MNFKEELYKHLPRLSNEEYQKYLHEESLGYIKINKHPEDENIVILNYTDLTTYDRRWNEQTISARGLILDLTNAINNDIIVLAKPFGKFFNYGENAEYEKDIDLNDIESVMEKMDGSLGISYFFEDGIRFATRGSFISEQAIKATEIWNEKYASAFSEFFSNPCDQTITILVEIIYPENRVVVNYKDKEDLVLIGLVDLFKTVSRDEYNIKFLGKLSKIINMPMAEVYDAFTIEDLIEKKKNIGFNDEGWVVKFTNGKRLKIKGDEYIRLHRLLYGISAKKKYQEWAEGNLQEYIKLLPEEFRDDLEKFEERVNRIKDEKIRKLQFLFNYINTTNNDKKLFAYKVRAYVSIEDRKYMFKAFETGVIPEMMVRDSIAKNYREYEV